jgi:hypothetical protein
MHLEIATIKMGSMTLLEQHDVFRSGKHRNIALFRSFSSIQSRDSMLTMFLAIAVRMKQELD